VEIKNELTKKTEFWDTTGEVNPKHLGEFQHCSAVRTWQQKDGFSLLWVYGPCGVGKTSLVKRFSLELSKRGRSCIYLNFIEFPTYSEILSYLSGKAGTFPAEYLILDHIEIFTSINRFLRERLLPTLPYDLKIIIVSRFPPDGGWIDPIWSELLVSVAVRPLGLEEALESISDRDNATDKTRAFLSYLKSGGRWGLLQEKNVTRREIITKFCREAGAGKYLSYLGILSLLWRFDKEMLPMIQVALIGLNMNPTLRELTAFSFISRDIDEYRMDPLLKMALQEEGKDAHLDLLRELLSQKATEKLTCRSGCLLTLLQKLVPPTLQPVFDERLPFYWHNQTGKGSLQIYHLKDPASVTVGTMVLARKKKEGPLVLFELQGHALLGEYIFYLATRQIIALCLQGEHILVPQAFKGLRMRLEECGRLLVQKSSSFNGGEFLSCIFSFSKIVTCCEKSRSVDVKKKEKMNSEHFQLNSELLRRELRKYHYDREIVASELAVLLHDDEQNLVERKKAQLLRQRIGRALSELDFNDRRYIQLACINREERSELARRLGIGERTLYRRIKKALDCLTAIINQSKAAK